MTQYVSEIQRKLNALELNLNDVDTTIDDTDVWPLIKDFFYFKFLTSFDNQNSKTPLYKKSRFFAIKKKYWALNYTFIIFRLKSSIRTRLKKFQFLFFDVTNLEYTDTIDEKSYSRFITPYFNRLESLFGNTGMVKLSLINEEIIVKYNKSINLDNILKAKKIYFIKEIDRMYCYADSFKALLSKFDDIQKNEEFSYKQYSDSLAMKFLEVKFYESIADKILSHVKPKAIFIETYYGHADYYGVMLSSNKMKIPVIDIQHGSSNTFLYNGFHYDNKKTLLPDYYWTWSKVEFDMKFKERLKSDKLKPILLGKCSFNELQIEVPANIVFLNEIRSKYSRVIVISFQYYFRNYEFLKELIKELTDCFFLLRFHPLDYKDKGFRQHYIDYFSELQNVEYKVCNDCNISTVFSFCDLHMTLFSTMLIDALQYGVRTILLDKNYLNYFQVYHDKNVLVVTDNFSDLKKLIRTLPKLNSSEMNYFSQVVSDEDFKTRLQNILN